MKNKLPIILLASALLINPVSSFADENIQEINQPAKAKVVEIEHENGDKELNPETLDNKDTKKTKNIKEQTPTQTDKKEEKPKEDNQKDIPLGQKDASKEVKKEKVKLQIVEIADDQTQDANYITVISEGTNKESITGFVYTLENKTTNEKIDLNFKDKNQIIVKGSDGEYTLTLKEKPKNFKEEKEMTFKMPYVTKKNQNGIDESTRLLQIKPKHILKPEVPNKPNPQTVDNKDLNFKIIGPILLAIIAILGYLLYDSKKKNDK